MNFECSIKQELYKNLLLYCENINNLYIAFSGGVDSCVLLDAICKLNEKLMLNKNIIAVHVNHNISKNSGHWEIFCQEFCKIRNIEIKSFPVNLKINKDETLESVARVARYNIFKNLIKNNNDILITAHHQNDQTETVLLNLFRGSGIDGLSGMKPLADLNNSKNKLLRPLLDIPKKLILDYATKNKLKWVDDESNESIDYSRNFLRKEIIPALQKKWPAIISKISHSAQHFDEAKNFIEEKIKTHYEASVTQDRFNYKVLDIDYFKNLNNTEQKYLLRYFIKNQNAAYPSKIKLDEILNQILNARVDADISICWKKDNNQYEIKRFKNKIYLLINFNHSKNINYKKYIYKLNTELYIKEIDKVIKFSNQDLEFKENLNTEISIEINFRKNLNANEVIVKINNRKTTLKRYFQESNIPTWRRDMIPLALVENVIKLVLI